MGRQWRGSCLDATTGTVQGRIGGYMARYTFNMSCGHTAEREVADPGKYYEIDRKYYEKQGLCDACWDKLREQHRTAAECRGKR